MYQADIAIIGGGISGLYCAYKILKQHPNKSIILLEADKRLGGRIHSYHDPPIYPSIESGAGRFHKNHKHLWQLLRELELEEKIVPISSETQYIPTKHPSQTPTNTPTTTTQIIQQIIQQIIESTKTIPKKTIQNTIFIDYVSKVLSKEHAQLILDSFGYSSELTDMNTYDTIQLLKNHYSQQYYSLKGGMEQIIDRLLEKLQTYQNFQYHLKTPILDITYQTQIFHIKSPKTTYKSKICICALIKEHLIKIPIFTPLRIQNAQMRPPSAPINRSLMGDLNVKRCTPLTQVLQGIKNLPLCRIYTQLSKPIPPIHQKITTNNKLRYIIPINPDKGTFMISYTDNHYANYWQKKYQTEGIHGVNRALKKYLHQTFPQHNTPIIPKHTKIFYWKHGVAYFQPGLDSTKDLKKIRHPFPQEIPTLFICGENYSEQNTQWIEGALDTIPSIDQLLL